MPKFLSNVDMNKNQITNRVLQILSSAPGSPTEGQEYYDSTLHGAYVYMGSAWAPYDARKLGAGTLPMTVLATDPLARANHTGTQLSATISDLASVVQAYKLNQFAAPIASVAMGSQKITGMADGTAATDAATWGQVQGLINGLSYKTAVRVASSTNVTVASPGTTIDGVTMATNDRVLLYGQTTGTENGAYVYNGSAVPLTRTTDFDAAAECVSGSVFGISEGTSADKLAILTTNGTITPGSTSMAFTVLSSGTSYVAGNGLTLSTNSFAVTPKASGGITVDGTGVSVDRTLVPNRFSATIGDGSTTSIVVTHNLNTRDVHVTVALAASTWDIQYCDVQLTSVNTVTLIFATAPATNALRVTVIG